MFSTFDVFLTFFLILTFFSSLSVVLSKNPLHSIIFLIMVFLNVVLILLLVEVFFLSMVFLIVYIGAVAVLFLFVIYMLNIKLIELNEYNNKYLVGLVFGSVYLLFILLFMFGSFYFNYEKIFDINTLYIDWIRSFYNFNNLKILSYFIFEEMYLVFIILGIVLLVAMVGAIILTTKRTYHLKEQTISLQNWRYF